MEKYKMFIDIFMENIIPDIGDHQITLEANVVYSC